ncbi:MAG TPA: MFS transporter, partial [Acidimicrobiales bacterium]|nr:MFS transporter [Acidimicrobiales bacterium]
MSAEAPVARNEGRSVRSVMGPLWIQVYLPNLIIAIGQGAISPILVYAAVNLHASSAVAAGVVAVNNFGTALIDVPSGRIVARFGESRATWLAGILMAGGLGGCLLAKSVAVLALAVFVQAGGVAIWGVARYTHVSRVAPGFVRGRALSVFGGV